MDTFLKRISSRKFLTALAVQVAVVVSMIWRPAFQEEMVEAAAQIAELVILLLAAMGYGKIEGGVDKAREANRLSEPNKAYHKPNAK